MFLKSVCLLCNVEVLESNLTGWPFGHAVIFFGMGAARGGYERERAER